MVQPDDWQVGVILEDGQKVVIEPGGGPAPSRIEKVYIPISFPWSEGPDLYYADIEAVADRERSSGQQTHYSARLEDHEPEPVDQSWYIEFEIWEYPQNVFNHATLSHSDNIKNAIWDPDDLKNAMD